MTKKTNSVVFILKMMELHHNVYNSFYRPVNETFTFEGFCIKHYCHHGQLVISNKSCCKHVLFTNLSDFISTTTRVTSVNYKKFLLGSFSVAKFGIAPSFGTNITENHLDNLSALFFGQALDQMGQKC